MEKNSSHNMKMNNNTKWTVAETIPTKALPYLDLSASSSSDLGAEEKADEDEDKDKVSWIQVTRIIVSFFACHLPSLDDIDRYTTFELELMC